VDVALGELSGVQYHVFASADNQEALAFLRCEGHDGSTDGGFIAFNVDSPQNRRLLADRINYANARSPPAPTARISEVFWWENPGVAIFDTRGFQELLTELWRKGVVLGFDGVEVWLVRMLHQTAWCVSERYRFLDEVVSEFLN
jgi:hypothetical protein